MGKGINHIQNQAWTSSGPAALEIVKYQVSIQGNKNWYDYNTTSDS